MSILATNNDGYKLRAISVPIATLFAAVIIPIEVPVFVWYVTSSPVCNEWFGRYIDCAATKIEVVNPILAPGFSNVIVLPDPTTVPAAPTGVAVPNPTDSPG